jgi:hypothetical protein
MLIFLSNKLKAYVNKPILYSSICFLTSGGKAFGGNVDGFGI